MIRRDEEFIINNPQFVSVQDLSTWVKMRQIDLGIQEELARLWGRGEVDNGFFGVERKRLAGIIEILNLNLGFKETIWTMKERRLLYGDPRQNQEVGKEDPLLGPEERTGRNEARDHNDQGIR